MKKNIVYAFIFFTSILSAQTTLTGTLTDATNKTPLFGVNIYIANLQRGTTSDATGKYLLKNIPQGTFNVTFEYIGYQTLIKTIRFENKSTILNLTLKPSVLEMDEIIISIPFNKIQSENVVKVTHKKVKKLLQSGSVTLIDGLTNIPGVSQLSSGTGIGKPVIRGLSGNRVLVYAQGVRLENQQFGNDHSLGINEAGVESVEIIKGPASLLYGSDALGGVIYLNPERFNQAGKTSFDIEEKYFTNTQGTNISGVFKTSSEHFQFLWRNTLNTHIDYKLPNNLRTTNSRYREYDIKTGLSYHNNFLTSTLRYNYNNFLTGIIENIGIQSTNRSPSFPKQRVENHILSLKNKFFFNDLKIDVNLGYIFNNRNEFESNINPNLSFQLKTFDYDFKIYLPKKNKLETIIGLQGMHQTNTNKAEDFLIPNATTNDIGILATSNYAWKEQALQGGLRFDNRRIVTQAYLPTTNLRHMESIDKNYTSFNASLGYKTTLESNITARFNLATGFRAPNLAELTSNGIHEGTNRFEIGNSELKTENNFQTDIDLSYRNKHIEFFINIFYNNINNYIFISPTGEQREATDVYVYNQKNANLYGGEIGFHLHPHPLDWFHLESSFETVTGKEKNGNYIPLVPANSFKNNLRAEFKTNNWLKNGYASLNINTTLAQNKPSTFETKSPAYTLVNFSLGGDIILNNTKYNVSISATNLFDVTYIPFTSFLKTLGIPGVGRNIVMSVNFSI